MFAKEGVAVHNGISYTLEPIHSGLGDGSDGGSDGRSRYRRLRVDLFAIAVVNAGLMDLRIIADEVQDGVPAGLVPNSAC